MILVICPMDAKQGRFPHYLLVGLGLRVLAGPVRKGREEGSGRGGFHCLRLTYPAVWVKTVEFDSSQLLRFVRQKVSKNSMSASALGKSKRGFRNLHDSSHRLSHDQCLDMSTSTSMRKS